MQLNDQEFGALRYALDLAIQLTETSDIRRLLLQETVLEVQEQPLEEIDRDSEVTKKLQTLLKFSTDLD